MKLYPISFPENCLDVYYITERGEILDDNESYIKFYHSTNGFDYVPIMTLDKYKLYPVDEIIMRTILGHVPGCNGIKHIDGNNRNNNIENLKWIIEDEKWEVIEKTTIQPGEYYVSNFGGFTNKRQTFYKSSVNSRGYIIVKMMTTSFEVTSEPLHRLIAEKFVMNPDIYLYNEINHIDGDKTNNHWKNLEWVTHEMNMRHAFDMNMVHRAKGEELYLTKISVSAVHEICRLFSIYQGRAESVYHKIKETYPDVTLKMVQHIKNKECWSHISDLYWSKEELVKLQEQKIRLICNHLLMNNGDTYKTLDSLKSIVPDITKRYIELIKYKESYTDISDEYFSRGQFDNRLSESDINKIQKCLIDNNMDVSSVYMQLKNQIPNLSKKKIYAIKYKTIDEFKNGG